MKQVFSFRFVAAALIVLSTVLVVPTIAQDESPTDVVLVTNTPVVAEPIPTVEPTPVVEPTPIPVPPSPFETIMANVNWTVIILAVVLSFFGFLSLVVSKLAVSAPVALWEGGKATVRATYDDVKKIVDATPDPTDNLLWDTLQGKFEEWIKSVDEQRGAAIHIHLVANDEASGRAAGAAAAEAIRQGITSSSN